MQTSFESKCFILGKLYADYKQDPEFESFIEFNDLGLPLAYLVSERLCQASDDGMRWIDETWQLFLTTIEVEDTGFEELGDVFKAALEDD